MFKKGDKVKVIGNSNSHCYEIGSTITVGKLHDDFSNFEGVEETYFNDTDKCSWFVKYKDCELIEPNQNKPEHYKTTSIDVIDFVKLYDLNFNLGNVVKYVCRNKGTDKEDYKKAIDYLQRELKYLESLDN